MPDRIQEFVKDGRHENERWWVFPLKGIFPRVRLEDFNNPLMGDVVLLSRAFVRRYQKYHRIYITEPMGQHPYIPFDFFNRQNDSTFEADSFIAIRTDDPKYIKDNYRQHMDLVLDRLHCVSSLLTIATFHKLAYLHTSALLTAIPLDRSLYCVMKLDGKKFTNAVNTSDYSATSYYDGKSHRTLEFYRSRLNRPAFSALTIFVTAAANKRSMQHNKFIRAMKRIGAVVGQDCGSQVLGAYNCIESLLSQYSSHSQIRKSVNALLCPRWFAPSKVDSIFDCRNKFVHDGRTPSISDTILAHEIALALLCVYSHLHEDLGGTKKADEFVQQCTLVAQLNDELRPKLNSLDSLRGRFGPEDIIPKISIPSGS